MRRPKPIPAKPRIEQLDSVLLREPAAFKERFERAGLLRELGRYDEAKRDYLELIRLRPTDFGVLNDFGTLALKAGYKEQAREHFEAALRVDPDHVHAHRGIGNLLAEAGNEFGARWHRDKGFRSRFMTPLPYRGPERRVLLLVLL